MHSTCNNSIKYLNVTVVKPSSLQCSDTVGWVKGRHPTCTKSCLGYPQGDSLEAFGD